MGDDRRRRARLRAGRFLARGLVAVAVGCALAAPAGAADYAGALAKARADAKARLAAGAVVSKGRVVWTGVDGTGVRAGDVFSLASMTKPYTAVLVLQLVQRRRLSLATPIGHWLHGRIPRAAGRVTVRELLRHTSGLPDYLGDKHVAAALSDPHHRWTEAELLRAVRAPRHRGRFSYSNTNYLLLGAILRRITHEGEDALLTQRILSPLGLDDTAMRRSGAFAARVAGGGRLANDIWGPLWSDGGIVATADDVARFLDGLLVGGRLLAPDTLRTMLAPGPDRSYGMGIYSARLYQDRVYGHDGAYGGWYSYGVSDRRTGTTLVVMVRGGNGDVNTALLDLAAAAHEAGLI